MREQLVEEYEIEYELETRDARENLLAFTLATFPDYDVNWHHKILCQKLDDFVAGKIKRLMVFMPPRYGKSELVSRRLPAYIFGRSPNEQIIACSYGDELASRMNRDVQRIMDCPRYREIFPHSTLYGQNVRSLSQGTWLRNNDIFEIVKHKGIYRSAGIGSGITGMGFSTGLIDDPIKNREEADSPTYREKIWEWYGSTFRSRMEKDAKILVTTTRWHEDDLAGRLLDLAKNDPTADQWEVVRFPAIKESEDIPHDPRQEGEPLWPNKFPLSVLIPTKAMGSRNWNALYQQRPGPEDGSIFKTQWFKFWGAKQKMKLPDKFDEHLQGWDMTFKETKKGSFVTCQIWGRKGADKFLLDQFRDRIDYVDTKKAFRVMSDKWPLALLKLVEDKANGPAIISDLGHEIPGIVAVTPRGSKEARAHSISPQFEAGNVYIPDPAEYPWVRDYMDELIMFPNGMNDDQVDTTSMVLERMAGKSLAVPVGPVTMARVNEYANA